MAKTREYSVYTSTTLREVKGKSGRRWKGVLKYRDQGGKWRQVAKTFGPDVRTKTQANKALQEWRDEMEDEAKRSDGAKKSVVQYATECIELRSRHSIYGMRKLEDSTTLDYNKVLKKLSPAFDSLSIAEVTPKFVNDWYVQQMEDGASVHAIRKCHRLLSMVFGVAFRREDIDVNPMARVDAPEATKKEADSLTHDDMRLITQRLESMEPTPVVVAAYIGLHAGLRCAEVCALRWRDVDFEAGTITVRKAIGYRKGGAYEKDRTKTGKSRTVDFDSEHMVDVLTARKARMLAERDNITTGFQELFVVGDVSGDFAKPTVISRHWTEMAKEWGLVSVNGGKCNFHLLRHSYITAALEAGANLKDVAANAGHASTAMTADTYATALRKGKKKAAQAAGDYMRPKEADVLPLQPTGTTD